MPGDLFFQKLKLAHKSRIAADIYRFEFVHPEGKTLPVFDAGAHVTVETPGGARRNYSLCNNPAENNRYVLAVKADANGRGGSLSMAQDTREGNLLKVSSPANNFPLDAAEEYIFVAGGIGITPIMSMLYRLWSEEFIRYRLIYCTRNAESTAFLDELTRPEFKDHITVHHDEGDPDKRYDFWPLFEKPGKAHVYICGPAPMMSEVRDMTGHWPRQAIHMEDFGSDVQAVKPDDRAFKVRHADSGEMVEIPADATILETLRKRGSDLPSSCESGTCGTCKTVLVAGVADHRDMVLTDEEKRNHIMICVSRALSDELVLRW